MTDPETRAIPVDVADLCERLRKIAAAQREVRGDMMMYGHPDPWLAEAATALETLAAENTRLREAIDNIKYEAGRDKGGLVHLRRCISAQFAALSPITQVKESQPTEKP